MTKSLYIPTFGITHFKNKPHCIGVCNCGICIISDYIKKNNTVDTHDTLNLLGLEKKPGDSSCYILYKHIVKEKLEIWKSLC
jgi:hypothetical protein